MVSCIVFMALGSSQEKIFGKFFDKNKNSQTTTASSFFMPVHTLGDSSGAVVINKHAPSNAQKYVVFSTRVFDRNTDHYNYDYLAPLVAWNWFSHGEFIPIIMVIYPNQKVLEDTLKLWKLFLPSEKFVPLIVPILVVDDEANNQRISTTRAVSQLTRLYVSHLIPDLPDDAYLRLVENDYMILDPQKYLPSLQADISIYNGRKYFRNKDQQEKQKCNQYPIHSPSMKVKDWRRLFPLEGAVGNFTNDNDIAQHMLQIVKKYFNNEEDKMNMLAETMLGCTIDQAVRAQDYKLELISMGNRLEFWLRPENNRGRMTDVHLDEFRFSNQKHRAWLDKLVANTPVLSPSGGEERQQQRQAYREYTEQWGKQFSKR